MEILLLVITLVIAACVVYIAVSLDRRISRKIDPLLKKTVRAASARTDERVGNFAALLAVNLENARTELDERMSQLDVRIAQAVAPLAAQLDGLKDLIGHVRAAQVATNRMLHENRRELHEIGDAVQEVTRQADEISSQLTVGAEQSARHTDALRALLRQVTTEYTRAGEQLAAIGRALDRQAQAAARGEEHDRWAVDQMISTAHQVQALVRSQADAIGFLRATLDEESRRGNHDDYGRRVILVLLPAGGQEDDIVRELAGAFSERIMLTKLLPAGAAGEKGPGCYFAWRSPDGERLEDVLAAVLAACPDSTAAPLAGLDELRGLLLALRASGPGTARIGPLVLVSTGTALLGAVINVEESGQFRVRPEPPTPDDIADWLRGLGDERVVELAEWADGYLDES